MNNKIRVIKNLVQTVKDNDEKKFNKLFDEYQKNSYDISYYDTITTEHLYGLLAFSCINNNMIILDRVVKYFDGLGVKIDFREYRISCLENYDDRVYTTSDYEIIQKHIGFKPEDDCGYILSFPSDHLSSENKKKYSTMLYNLKALEDPWKLRGVLKKY